MKTKVLIVGGGPVGLTLAIDLAWRGIDVMVAERRPSGDPPDVKCGQIGARSMEVFRRLGVADKLRSIGLPPDYPNDIVSATSVTGIELSRVLIPARGARGTPAAAGPDTTWPTPEHTHRCNQKFFEPVLFAHAAEQPRIRILYRTEITEFSQGEHGVTASAVDLDRGTRSPINRLPRRMRRGDCGCAQVDRLRVRRHPGASARAIFLYPGAQAQEPATRQAGLAPTSLSIPGAAD